MTALDLAALEAAAKALLHDEAHGHMCPSCDEYGIPSLMVEQAEAIVALLARLRRAEEALREIAEDAFDCTLRQRGIAMQECARAALEGRADG